jgi:UDP-glucose 4-epimerase
MSVLVTGGAGYIGSHVTNALVDQGETVVVLDNLSTGDLSLVDQRAIFVKGDVLDHELLCMLLRDHDVNSVLHFAGSVVVPESVQKPLWYYRNNVIGSQTLINACVHNNVRNFIFSSTAAVYGVTETGVVSEESAKAPISPYGRSKLMTEWMLADTAAAHDFRYTILRYFNVAGADPLGRTGQSTPKATHLIKKACRVALSLEPYLEIFGSDFPTRDGTGVRDYIHVADLAHAHLLSLNALRQGKPSEIFNCGYGNGFSVREVISAVERVGGTKLEIRETGRRPGDPATLVANPAKILKELGWESRYSAIDVIVSSALKWEKKLLRRDREMKGPPS